MTGTTGEAPDTSGGDPTGTTAPPLAPAPPPASADAGTPPSDPEADPAAEPGIDEDELLESDLAEDDAENLPPSVTVNVGPNSGQVAGIVYGNLYQHFDRMRDYHELTERYVREQLSTFVEPGYRRTNGELVGSSEAIGLLRLYGATVLVAKPGTGRRTAALRLLDGTDRTLREIRAFDPARDEQLGITALPVHAGVAYLLELPERAPQVHPGFARDLAAHGEALAKIGSYLVVTVTEEVWSQLDPEADGPVLRVLMPPARRVLDAQLRKLFPELDLGWLPDTPAVSNLLTAATPVEAVRLARLTNDLLGASRGGLLREELLGPDQPAAKELLEGLASAFRNWEAELRTWFSLHQEPRPRLFLVAAAALAGATPGRVLWAAEQLGTQLGDDTPVGLAESGVRALLDQVGASLDRTGRVQFRRPRYGDAVLDFVITDRTDNFQYELWRWMAKLPLTENRIDRTLAATTAELLLRTALRRRSPEILAVVTPIWARRAELRTPLVELLGLAALSPEIGTATRRRLYRWAAVRHHPSVLATVAQVCGGRFADFYIEQALVRLGQLARWGLPEVDEAVLAALRSIWDRPTLRTPLLLRLARWLSGSSVPRIVLAGRALELVGRPSGPAAPRTPDTDPSEQPIPHMRVPVDPAVEIVDEVLDAVLDASPEMLGTLGTAVGHAVTHSAERGSAVVVLLHRWWDVAAGDQRRTRLVTHLLAGAVGADPAAGRRIARIRALLYEWQPPAADAGRPAHGALRDHLVKELHRADPTPNRPSRPRTWSTNGTV